MTTLEPSVGDELLLADTLRLLKPDTADHPMDYRDCCVLKPWGWEWELFDDKKHAIWMLNIKPNRSTSLHCHQHKAVCLVPLIGEITVITLDQRFTVRPMESISLLPKVFHCLWNSGQSDVKLVEIETPSIKLDLVRAEDAYGRAKDGYEGESCIVRENLEQYGYCRIGEDETITRFGHDISIGPAGISIRKPVDA
jgi:mannose-6-phosphate isomerase-like protein (cupin superfamily)